jgi:hypothetical protein
MFLVRNTGFRQLGHSIDIWCVARIIGVAKRRMNVGLVMFCEIICTIRFARLPINIEFFVFDAISEPIEVHVYGFCSFLFDGVVEDAFGFIIVGLDEGGWLCVV